MTTSSMMVGAAALALAIPAATACGGSGSDGLSEEELAKIAELSPLPEVPPEPTNRFADDPAAAMLGQALFFESSYSGPLRVGDDGENGALGAEGETGKVACASCHIPTSHFSDSRSNPNNVSLGTGFTTRNAPTLVNVAFYEQHGWGGKQDSLATQASLSPESGSNTGGNRCGYAHMVWDLYRDLYDAVFVDTPLPTSLDPSAPDADRFPESCKPKSDDADPDGPWEMMTPDDQHAINQIMWNCGRAIAAYERLLVSRNAPFDRYVAGDVEAISEAAERGLRLFVGKAGCVDCHSGPFFSDQEYHNTAVPQVGPNVPEEDQGRYADVSSLLRHQFNTASEWSDDPAAGAAELEGLMPREEDRGAFRTKSLREVSETAPYFHNGSMATLRDVVELYNAGGGTEGFVGTPDPRMVPLNLTESEVDDLVAFLETLTGEPIPNELLEDTSR